MKTTLDLPEDLLIEAKTVAARRRTTLKAIIEKALRRELNPRADAENPDTKKFDVNELGFLVIRKRADGRSVTPETIRAIQDEIDEEDVQRARSQGAS